MKTGITSLKT